MMRAAREDTLATFDVHERTLPGLRVPVREELNPPLWELGHVGWFLDWWIGRNPQWRLGVRADPGAARSAAVPVDAEALYHSSLVRHADRWSLPLPDARTTRGQLAAQLDRALERLDRLDADGDGSDDDALYFFRLALLHEDMHHEAALYMAQGLGVPIADPRWQAPALPAPPPALRFDARLFTLGAGAGRGFAFDNEIGGHAVPVGAFEIDAQAVRWAEYLPFVEAGGYADGRWWDDAGRRWLGGCGATAPRYLRRDGDAWSQWRHGSWRALDPAEPACHLSAHEAAAWCRWAGRSLPTEAQWELAACTRPDAFRWGDAWEWTSSPFAPYPGFFPHPYRDYSAPWFDGRPVLRGASFMTQPRMRHPRYRNFFPAWRTDVPAGFRSCGR